MFKYLFVLALVSVGCGGGYESTSSPGPVNDPEYESVRAIVDANCGTCHNGSTHPLKLQSSADFKQAKVKARIESGSMPPPPRSLNASDKSQLLGYLSR
jgi:uncharacterized membrane protein